MVARVLGYVIWGFIAVMIVITGWDEPLRYRTMNQTDISAEERAAAATPLAVRMPVEQWHPLGTALDRGAYKRSPTGIIYNEKSDDPFKMGTSTEVQMRPNRTVSGVDQGGLAPR
jgi:hypothetical protein